MPALSTWNLDQTRLLSRRDPSLAGLRRTPECDDLQMHVRGCLAQREPSGKFDIDSKGGRRLAGKHRTASGGHAEGVKALRRI